MTYRVSVLENESLQTDVCRLRLAAGDIARQAVPGQFIQVKTSQLLRRPFAVMDSNPAAGTIDIGIHRVGRGSDELCRVKPGDELSILGPFGQGFNLPNRGTIILVGGGSGLFPLYFLGRQAAAAGLEVISLLGFASRDRSFLSEQFRDISHRLMLCSEAGDLDRPGFVTAGLSEVLGQIDPAQPATIYACGPIAMLEAVVVQAEQAGRDSFVSLEVRMGCGFGVCRGCPVDIRQQGQIRRVRCCVEGPVFAGRSVVFESLRGEDVREAQYV